ncbi:MAG: acyl-CoA dehydrogenase [Alphaproteobacteria bacterium]|nr:acyl-CoA dehydrogenase [Alphaproteobacteria bacterium]
MSLRLSTAPAEKTVTEEYLSRVRSIAPVIAGASDSIESGRRLTPELVSALHGAGMYRLLLPKKFGGGEVDPATFHQVISEVAQYDASTAWCLGQGNGCAMAAAYVAPEIADKVWGQDPHAVLAWGPPGKATAVDEGDHFRVTGIWAFASGMRHATWLGGHSTVVEPDGTPRKGPNGGPMIRTMLIPFGDAKVTDIWHVMGLRGTASDQFEVTDYRVPREYTLTREDPLELHYESPLYQFPQTALYSIGFSGTAIGIARSMLESFKELAGEKTPRRMKSVLRDNGLVQMEVGLAEARLRAARAYILNELADIWGAVQSTGKLTVPQRMRIRLMTTFGIHEAKKAADAVYDLAGATAIFKSSTFERKFRDIHTVTQQVQGRKSNIQSVGSFLLGNTPDMSVI